MDRRVLDLVPVAAHVFQRPDVATIVDVALRVRARRNRCEQQGEGV